MPLLSLYLILKKKEKNQTLSPKKLQFQKTLKHLLSKVLKKFYHPKIKCGLIKLLILLVSLLEDAKTEANHKL